jgi:hypothetical protein
MIFDSIDALNPRVTLDATPVNEILFEAQPDSAINARILIIARRTSDGLVKAWDMTASMRRVGFGAAENLATRDGAPYLAPAPMAGVGVTFFSDANGNIGATLTGLAATEIQWGIMLRGIQIVN